MIWAGCQLGGQSAKRNTFSSGHLVLPANDKMGKLEHGVEIDDIKISDNR